MSSQALFYGNKPLPEEDVEGRRRGSEDEGPQLRVYLLGRRFRNKVPFVTPLWVLLCHGGVGNNVPYEASGGSPTGFDVYHDWGHIMIKR